MLVVYFLSLLCCYSSSADPARAFTGATSVITLVETAAVVEGRFGRKAELGIFICVGRSAMQTNCLMRGTLAAETHTQSQTQSQSQSQLQPQAKTKAKGRKEEGSHPQTVFRGGGAVVGMPRQRKKDEQKEDVALGGELTFNNEIYIGNAPQTSNLLPKMIAWKRAAMSREDYRYGSNMILSHSSVRANTRARDAPLPV